ncbi:MAG: hypothetical protein KF718_02835 [Polyangiaceae bacterium]|nr:hypothetical protein [Polyangiaceae bacterium]
MRALAVVLVCSLPACDRTPAASPSPDAPTATVSVGAASAAPRPTPRPSASTEKAWPGSSAASRDGTLRLRAQPVSAFHTHGGQEAQVGRFLLSVTNTGSRERRLTLTTLVYLTGKSCDEPPTTIRARPKPELLVRDDDHDLRPPSTTAAVPPRSEVVFSAQFESVGAYYTRCDTFGLVASFLIDDGDAVRVGVEIRVQREDP